jgi:predicted nucleic acid-binding protein
MRVLADTSVLVAFDEPDEPPPRLEDSAEVFVSSVCYSELVLGVAAAASVAEYRRRAARLAALQALLGPGLPYDDACAASLGVILAHVSESGGDVKSRRFDRMIAATALARGLTVVTRNAADLADLAGLVEVRPA